MKTRERLHLWSSLVRDSVELPDTPRNRVLAAAAHAVGDEIIRAIRPDHTWLAFKPAYDSPRGGMSAVLGTHAFREGAAKSICGYAPRAKAGDRAGADARRCVWCERVIAGTSAEVT